MTFTDGEASLIEYQEPELLISDYPVQEAEPEAELDLEPEIDLEDFLLEFLDEFLQEEYEYQPEEFYEFETDGETDYSFESDSPEDDQPEVVAETDYSFGLPEDCKLEGYSFESNPVENYQFESSANVTDYEIQAGGRELDLGGFLTTPDYEPEPEIELEVRLAAGIESCCAYAPATASTRRI